MWRTPHRTACRRRQQRRPRHCDGDGYQAERSEHRSEGESNCSACESWPAARVRELVSLNPKNKPGPGAGNRTAASRASAEPQPPAAAADPGSSEASPGQLSGRERRRGEAYSRLSPPVLPRRSATKILSQKMRRHQSSASHDASCRFRTHRKTRGPQHADAAGDPSPGACASPPQPVLETASVDLATWTFVTLFLIGS